MNAFTDRHFQGGHDVPPEKVVERYVRSLAQVKDAIPAISRAYFFDNSGPQMLYLGQYSRENGFEFSVAADRLPRWFRLLDLQG